MTPIEYARRSGRGYITPEDVTDSRMSGCDDRLIKLHVLRALSGSYGWGVEDRPLTAWLAMTEDEQNISEDEI